MYRVAIIERNNTFSDFIREYIEKQFEDFTVDVFTSISSCKLCTYDCLFVEIEEDNRYKVRTKVDWLTHRKKGVPIIFTTLNDKFVKEGYLHSDFAVLKKSDVEEYIDKIIGKVLLFFDFDCIYVSDEEDIAIKTFIKMKDIEHIYVEGNYSLIYTSNRTFKKRTTATKLLKDLTSEFFEISRGQIINVNKIYEVNMKEYFIVMSNGNKVKGSIKRMSNLAALLDKKFSVG